VCRCVFVCVGVCMSVCLCVCVCACAYTFRLAEETYFDHREKMFISTTTKTKQAIKLFIPHK
jgi:hypothetical protein